MSYLENLYPDLVRGNIVYSSYQHLRVLGQRVTIDVEVEELQKPMMRGATLRTHRVWSNGHPAGGGSWRHCLEDAIAHADSIITESLASKVSKLNQRVSTLEADNAQLRAEVEALREGREYERIGL